MPKVLQLLGLRVADQSRQRSVAQRTSRPARRRRNAVERPRAGRRRARSSQPTVELPRWPRPGGVSPRASVTSRACGTPTPRTGRPPDRADRHRIRSRPTGRAPVPRLVESRPRCRFGEDGDPQGLRPARLPPKPPRCQPGGSAGPGLVRRGSRRPEGWPGSAGPTANQRDPGGMRSTVAQCASRSRCTRAGPFSIRLNCACVIPSHPATTLCGSGFRPWYGWCRYARITCPRCRPASAARSGSWSQNDSGTAGGVLRRSRSAAWQGAQRPVSLSRARRPPQRGQFAGVTGNLAVRGEPVSEVEPSHSTRFGAARYTHRAYRRMSRGGD